jgi:hypothetical protein
MSTHAEPFAAHWRHWWVRAGFPVQKVSIAVSVSPANGCPLTGGGTDAHGRSALRAMSKDAQPVPAAFMFQFTVKSLPAGTVTE